MARGPIPPSRDRPLPTKTRKDYEAAAWSEAYAIMAGSALLGLAAGAVRSWGWAKRRRLDPARRLGRAGQMAGVGMLVGAAAQLILGREGKSIDWTMAIVAGLVGSFVGGLLASLLAGDGIQLRASGIIGSIVGAILVTLVWNYWQGRQRKAT